MKFPNLAKYLLFLFPVLLILTPSVYSAETPANTNFSAAFDVTYNTVEDGKTQVDQKITLTNKNANYYAKEYNLSIGSTKISNVTARDSGGNITTKVKTEANATTINLTFNDQVIGLGKSLKFSLGYQVDDITSHNGSIWEINIPKLAISADVVSYDLKLKIPESFGEVNYLSPTPLKTENGKVNVYHYNKEQLEKTGISAAFGKFQVYSFTLKYHLFNPNIFKATAVITFPPDTNNQQVIFDEIVPTPTRFATDQDGNYLGNYDLGSRQKIEVVAKGYIKMVEPHQDLQIIPSVREEKMKEYLASSKYWNIDNTIKEKAKALTENLKDNSTDGKARSIYEFVASFLSYDKNRLDLTRIDRLGALGAINNPKNAICMEYTDLFIALARAAGIPAREINGYAYTSNQALRPTTIGGKVTSDLLHAWPEYYSFENKRWYQIDPTWGSTTGGVDYFGKLDTNHIVFVRKGLSPDEPLPAGAFKIDSDNSGDIDIKPVANFKSEEPIIELKLSNGNLPAGFSSNVILQVTNKGKRAFFSGKLTLDPSLTDIITPSEVKLDPVLPGQTQDITLKIKTPNLLSRQDISLKGVLSGSDGEKENKVGLNETIRLRPFFTFGILPIFLGLLLLAILGTIFLLLKRELKALKRHPKVK